LIWLWLLACADPCALRWGSGKEECRFEQVKTAFVSEDTEAFNAALNELDPLTRDLARVRLAVLHPKEATRLCGEVREAVALQKCQQILGRPHLQGGAR
jgi:hypothetical protein